MATLGLLVGLVGAIGSVLTYIVALPAMTQLPVPALVWPIATVVGFVLFYLMRQPGD